MYNKLPIALGAALAVGVAGFAGGAWPKLRETRSSLGRHSHLTGKYSTNGFHTQKGYDFAVKRINDTGGVKVGGKSYKMKIVYYDDESTPSRASQLTERLVKQDGVEFMLGPYSTTMTKAVAPVTEKYKVPMVEAEGASRSLFTQGYKYMFAVLSTSEYYLLRCLTSSRSALRMTESPHLISVSAWRLRMMAFRLMFVPELLMLQKNTI